MAAAWGRLKGRADEHIRNNATRAASEENRRLRSDVEQRRMGKDTAGQGSVIRATRDVIFANSR
eukprot:7921517-Pyramimonas_sp.AAC.1